MSEHTIEIEKHGHVVWIWLNRPDVHNAFDATLIKDLTRAYVDFGRDPEIRVIVLAARGKSFSAGAQVQWMKEQGAASKEENVAGARRLAKLFQTIADSPKPTIARVQGSAFGGGVGLVAASDIAIGSKDAQFATTEVRLGIIPATIGPYVVRAVGERHARRLFLTGERVEAVAAERMGLLHEAVEAEQLDSRIQAIIDALLTGAPHAQREAKELVAVVANRPITPELVEETAQRITARRSHHEAAEGLNAFLEKRPPSWVPQVNG